MDLDLLQIAGFAIGLASLVYAFYANGEKRKLERFVRAHLKALHENTTKIQESSL